MGRSQLADARPGPAGRSHERQRIRPPALPEVAVSRPRLVESLEAAAAKRLVLVIAPPGYGKSVLLAQWVGSVTRRAIAWLSVEPTDDATRLAAHICAALTEIDGRPRDQILDRVVFGGREMGDSFISALLEDAATLPSTALVLDDFHALDAPLVAEIARIIELAPPQLHFVVSARIDPALPYHRLRLNDELAQLRQEDLLFEAGDAAQLVERITRLSLTESQLAMLLARTEGWGAGLQLAALSLRRHPDVDGFINTFAGDDRHVAEYLTEHVLRHQTPEVRDFLLETSVLDRLSASLCDAVTGRHNGRQMLEFLSRGSFFVTRIDSQGVWFRSHQLFRDLMRHHLRAAGTDIEPELLNRAASWHIDNDDSETAGDYIVQVGDDLQILDVARMYGRRLYRDGRIAAVVRWLESVSPQAQGAADVSLLMAACSMLAGETAVAEAILDDPATRSSMMPPECLVADLIRTWSVHDQPVPQRVLAAAERALSAIETVRSSEVPDILGLTSAEAIRTGCLLNAAAAATFEGSSGLARSYLADAAAAGYTTSSLEIDAFGLDALVASWGGSLRSAEQQGTRAVAAATQAGRLAHPGTAVALLALARVARQRDRLDQARTLLDSAESGLQRTHPAVLLAVYAGESALLALAEGDPERGLSILTAHRAATAPEPPRRVSETLRAAEARVLVALGDLDRAERLLEPLPGAGTELVDVAVRIAVERGDFGRARLLVADWPNDDDPGPRVQRLLWMCILDEVDGADADVVRRRLEGLVGVASEEGLFRMVLDTGHHALRLIRSLYHASPTPYLRRLVGTPLPLSLVSARPVMPLVEQLSDRERAVLRYLPIPLDNVEIAHELGVSVNTLKTHLKHIYRKLDVTSRRGAVAAAEELHLL